MVIKDVVHTFTDTKIARTSGMHKISRSNNIAAYLQPRSHASSGLNFQCCTLYIEKWEWSGNEGAETAPGTYKVDTVLLSY